VKLMGIIRGVTDLVGFALYACEVYWEIRYGNWLVFFFFG
jgi:hypothetical protein